jgi:hypothetical protein
MGGACCTPADEGYLGAQSKTPGVKASTINNLWAVHRMDKENPRNKSGEDKQEEIKAFLQREDTNDDGKLDRSESEKICKKFFYRATQQDTKQGKHDDIALNEIFKMFDTDSDGQLDMKEFGLMMKTYWLMKVPGLKINEFLEGQEATKWNNLVREFQERQSM